MKKTLITFIISIFLMNSSFSQISTEFQLKEASKVADNSEIFEKGVF